MAEALIGVIGGTGLYRMDGLEGVEEVAVDTPFGPPSDVHSDRRAQRSWRGVPAEAWQRASDFPVRVTGEGQHLRSEVAGRAESHISQRGRQPAGGDSPA